ETPVIIGEKNDLTKTVFLTKAQETNSPLYFAEDKTYPHYDCELKGSYQKQNIQTVLAAVDVLQKKQWNINQENLREGMNKVSLNTGLQGRWQQLGDAPKIICDTGHNKDGLAFVMQQLAEE